LNFERYYTVFIFRQVNKPYIGGHDLDLSRSRDVIGHVTIRFLVGHFLFVSLGSFSVRP